MSQPTELEVLYALESLIVKLEAGILHEEATRYNFIHSQWIEVKTGRTYYRLVRVRKHNDGNFFLGPDQHHTFAFVRKSDGAIFRPATKTKPETRTKSAIHGYVTDENPEQYFSHYGVLYAQ
jgi:hypothetical protein